MDVGEFLKIAGGIAGLIALAWRVADEFGSWLRISVEVTEPADGWVFAAATVDNKGNRYKAVEYACLLVGPSEEDPVDSARELQSSLGHPPTITDTEEIGRRLKLKAPHYSKGRALIPLPFFYDENIRIEDETLRYSAAIDTSKLTKNGPQAVRFFIFLEGRLLRCTHDAFLIKA